MSREPVKQRALRQVDKFLPGAEHRFVNDRESHAMPPEGVSQTEPNAPAESPRAAPPRRRSRAGVLLCAGLILLLGAASVPGYGWWIERRTDQFKTGCIAATKEQQWERLGLIATKWLAWDPRSNDAHVYLAESEFQAGRLQEAADLLGNVTDDYHGAVAALIFRGEMLYDDLHLPYEAEQTWQRILTIDPGNTHAHQRLVHFYALSLQRSRMVDQIRRSLQRRCEAPEAYAYLLSVNSLGFTQGLTHVRNWRQSYPEDETLEVAEAVYLAKYGENPNILAEYEESHFFSGDQSAIDACLQKYPQNMEVLAYHIEKRIYFDRADEVVALLKAAPAAAAEDSRFWRFRSWLLQQTGDVDQAIAALERSIELDRFGWRSRWELASTLRAHRRVAESRAVQELAMQGKLLQDALFKTDGRALTWGLVEDMRAYIKEVGDAEVLAALDARIRSQVGEEGAAELTGSAGRPASSSPSAVIP